MSMSQDILNLKASREYPVEVYAYTTVGVGEKSEIKVTTNIARMSFVFFCMYRSMLNLIN